MMNNKIKTLMLATALGLASYNLANVDHVYAQTQINTKEQTSKLADYFDTTRLADFKTVARELDTEANEIWPVAKSIQMYSMQKVDVYLPIKSDTTMSEAEIDDDLKTNTLKQIQFNISQSDNGVVNNVFDKYFNQVVYNENGDLVNLDGIEFIKDTDQNITDVKITYNLLSKNVETTDRTIFLNTTLTTDKTYNSEKYAQPIEGGVVDFDVETLTGSDLDAKEYKDKTVTKEISATSNKLLGIAQYLDTDGYATIANNITDNLTFDVTDDNAKIEVDEAAFDLTSSDKVLNIKYNILFDKFTKSTVNYKIGHKLYKGNEQNEILSGKLNYKYVDFKLKGSIEVKEDAINIDPNYLDPNGNLNIGYDYHYNGIDDNDLRYTVKVFKGDQEIENNTAVDALTFNDDKVNKKLVLTPHKVITLDDKYTVVLEAFDKNVYPEVVPANESEQEDYAKSIRTYKVSGNNVITTITPFDAYVGQESKINGEIDSTYVNDTRSYQQIKEKLGVFYKQNDTYIQDESVELNVNNVDDTNVLAYTLTFNQHDVLEKDYYIGFKESDTTPPTIMFSGKVKTHQYSLAGQDKASINIAKGEKSAKTKINLTMSSEMVAFLNNKNIKFDLPTDSGLKIVKHSLKIEGANVSFEVEGTKASDKEKPFELQVSFVDKNLNFVSKPHTVKIDVTRANSVEEIGVLEGYVNEKLKFKFKINGYDLIEQINEGINTKSANDLTKIVKVYKANTNTVLNTVSITDLDIEPIENEEFGNFVGSLKVNSKLINQDIELRMDNPFNENAKTIHLANAKVSAHKLALKANSNITIVKDENKTAKQDLFVDVDAGLLEKPDLKITVKDSKIIKVSDKAKNEDSNLTIEALKAGKTTITLALKHEKDGVLRDSATKTITVTVKENKQTEAQNKCSYTKKDSRGRVVERRYCNAKGYKTKLTKYYYQGTSKKYSKVIDYFYHNSKTNRIIKKQTYSKYTKNNVWQKRIVEDRRNNKANKNYKKVETLRYSNKKTKQVITIKYHTNGKWSSKVTKKLRSNGKQSFYETREYFKNGKLRFSRKYTKHTNGKTKKRTFLRYSDKGRKMHKEIANFSKKGKMTSKYVYRYNSKGQLKTNKHGKAWRVKTTYKGKNKTVRKDYNKRGKLV